MIPPFSRFFQSIFDFGSPFSLFLGWKKKKVKKKKKEKRRKAKRKEKKKRMRIKESLFSSAFLILLAGLVLFSLVQEIIEISIQRTLPSMHLSGDQLLVQTVLLQELANRR